ncbi:hypothetical protein [Luteolibacter sp. LG18]|uniref:hypothetical protein n=1 Tax=Luteolibacter sp. LG18 TaxID=2819286 RepID=UPI002B2C8477|nr:hypothetical protein llg_32230 [Luteolibacter sp. LG18]
MKRIPLPPRAIVLAALSLIAAALAPASKAATTESVPRGTLTTSADLLRVGLKPTLTWNVEFPSEISTVVDIIPPNTVVPKQDVTMKIRVLGASFQESLTSYLTVQAFYRTNGSAWVTAFSGLQTTVVPSTILVQKTITKNTKLDFGGRGYRSGWLTLYNTGTTSPNVVMLKNGDAVPDTTPAFQQGEIESFLKPYINSTTKKISIGPKDLIILYELGQTDTKASGFDLQDLVMLVTFE